MDRIFQETRGVAVQKKTHRSAGIDNQIIIKMQDNPAFP